VWGGGFSGELGRGSQEKRREERIRKGHKREKYYYTGQ
jgi:hypothetical protein